MSVFKLGSSIDKNKVFLLNYFELERRLDPHPYHQERKSALKRLSSIKCEKLRKVVESKKMISTDIIRDDIYIGLENIVSGTGDYINTKDKESISSAVVFKKGQILFPKLRPYLNKVHLADFDGLCSTEFHVYTSLLLKAKFLFIYLQSDLIVAQTKHLMSGNTLPRLQTDDIKNLLVPVFSIEKQNQIIKKYELAQELKKQKEQEAENLLGTIDSYLLDELGIVLPEKDNSLNNRIFKTSFQKVTAARFDPFYFLYCIETPKSTKYNTVFLKEIALIQKGQSITSSYIKTGQYPVIAGGQTSPYSHDKYNYSGNVITVSASGAYAGFVWYHMAPIFASDCSVVKSRNENECNTEFLFNVLKLKQKELYNLQQGAGQPHVYPSDISKLCIPLPKIKKQLEINSHIMQIREKAQQLQEESKEIFEQVKTEVEEMILGIK